MYGVVPREQQIIWEYWDRIHTVARAGGYYGAEFKSFRGVTQGDPLSPTNFNMVVEQWCGTGYRWRQGGKEVRTGGEGSCDIASTFSMRVMAWSHQRIRSGCRGLLTS